jgi:biopolymer transport protein ExbB/biopolymer transport protein TolQ
MHFTLSELWASMGPFARGIVIVLLVMSVGSLFVMGERLVFFFRNGDQSRAFADRIARSIQADGLTKTAESSPSGGGYLGRVLGAGLKAFKTAPSHADTATESVARALERQASREVETLKRGLGILATVGSTAPFVGLLGTVGGIITAFQKMADSGSGGLGTVSAGIAEALVTTALGLLVAIPAVMAFNFLQSWVDGRAVDISESSNEFLDVVARHFAPKA